MPIVQQGALFQPCLVTGNLQQLTGGAITEGSVRFKLINWGVGNPVGVIGVSIFPWNEYRVVSDVTGFFSLHLWGNDVINPANTLYLVTYFDERGDSLGDVQYSIVGPSFNMNTATPAVGIIPPVLTSTGYASGSPVSAANFVIAGWGTGATITDIIGVQERCSITITAGVGPVVAPTVVYTFPGPYPIASYTLGQMTSGSGTISDITSSSTTIAATYGYSGLPQSTKTYVLVFDTKGS